MLAHDVPPHEEVATIDDHDENDYVVIYLELQYGMLLDDEVEVVHDIVCLVVEVADDVIGLHDVMLLATEADEVEVDVRGLVLVV